jgi:S-adenosylmethionine-diacylglycerol 3-amino-3-carboxypropyl transferase
LPGEARDFWDAHPHLIAAGIGSGGKFERYFATFRNRVLPWVHSRKRVQALLAGGSLPERQAFYDNRWNTWRWRLMFNVFFSRFVMGRLGRDPAFFQYVEGSVSKRILKRAEHALVQLNPAENPYLQWILTGRFTTALPHALRAENFESIRRNLDNLHIHLGSIEHYLAANPSDRVDAFNLSDIFEYMSADNFAALLATLADHANRGARLAYWNMLVPRARPKAMAHRLRPIDGLGEQLLLQDKAFFYSRFVVEEVL